MNPLKLLLTTALLCAISTYTYAQDDELTVRNNKGVDISIAKSDVSESCGRVVYLMLTQSAKYKRNTRRLRKALNKELDLPKTLNKEIAVRFLVNCEGAASGFVTSKNIDPAQAKLVTQAFDKIQGWKPGIRRNKPTDMEIILLVEFKNGQVDRISRINPKALSL